MAVKCWLMMCIPDESICGICVYPGDDEGYAYAKAEANCGCTAAHIVMPLRHNDNVTNLRNNCLILSGESILHTAFGLAYEDILPWEEREKLEARYFRAMDILKSSSDDDWREVLLSADTHAQEDYETLLTAIGQ